jgi:hypothetical protein
MIKAIKGVFERFRAPKPMNPNERTQNPNERTQGAYDNMACCAGDPGVIARVQNNNGVATTTSLPPYGGPINPK